VIRRILLPVLACLGLLFGVYTVAAGAKPVPVAKPAAEPALAPFGGTIAGAGIVEASTQNIAVGAAVPGIVREIPVQVGSRVSRGDELFAIEDREARAELAVRETALASSKADLSRLESLPRAEDLPPAEARVAAAETALAQAKNELELAQGLSQKGALAVQEWDRRRFAVQSEEARLSEAKADLAKLRAGAWKPEIEVARAAAAAAEARVEAQKTELDRLVVRAPVAGTVLRVDVRPGEYAPAASTSPLILLGDVERMHVRIDIDENDAWRFRPGARAEGFVRGNRDLKTALEFVRVEPYVLPKKSLTGDSTERVDTRVLQVLYSFDPKSLAVYVGQQMDVFIESATREEAQPR
jgi:HlyD family secretion protein